MKTLITLCALVALPGCYDCQDSVTCDKTGELMQVCCAGSECEYRASGKIFKCRDSDCEDATNEALAYCSK